MVEFKCFIDDDVEFIELLYLYSKLLADANEKITHEAAYRGQQNAMGFKHKFQAQFAQQMAMQRARAAQQRQQNYTFRRRR